MKYDDLLLLSALHHFLSFLKTPPLRRYMGRSTFGVRGGVLLTKENFSSPTIPSSTTNAVGG